MLNATDYHHITRTASVMVSRHFPNGHFANWWTFRQWTSRQDVQNEHFANFSILPLNKVPSLTPNYKISRIHPSHLLKYPGFIRHTYSNIPDSSVTPTQISRIHPSHLLKYPGFIRHTYSNIPDSSVTPTQISRIHPSHLLKYPGFIRHTYSNIPDSSVTPTQISRIHPSHLLKGQARWKCWLHGQVLAILYLISISYNSIIYLIIFNTF